MTAVGRLRKYAPDYKNVCYQEWRETINLNLLIPDIVQESARRGIWFSHPIWARNEFAILKKSASFEGLLID